MRTRNLFALFAAAGLVLGVAGPAAASDEPAPSLHPDIAYALENEPGGVLLNGATVFWPETGATLTVDSLATASLSSPGNASLTPLSTFTTLAAVGTCASGKFCAYSGSGMLGTKLTFTTCPGTHSTTALAATRSVANARSSGSVSARNGTTVVSTISAGGSKSFTAKVTNVRCG